MLAGGPRCCSCGGRGPARGRAGCVVLLAVLAAQAVVGIVQAVTGVPGGLVVVHLLGAALVWVGVLRVLLDTHPALFGRVIPGPRRRRARPVAAAGALTVASRHTRARARGSRIGARPEARGNGIRRVRRHRLLECWNARTGDPSAPGSRAERTRSGGMRRTTDTFRTRNGEEHLPCQTC